MGKHILFISVPLRGHFNQILVLANELLMHDYRVSFLATKEEQDWISNPNINIIKIEYNSDTSNQSSKDVFWNSISQLPNRWKAEKLMLNRASSFYKSMYDSIYSTVKQEKPDLIIVDRALIAAMDISRKYNIPLIIQTRYIGSLIGTIPEHPYFGSSFPIQMNFNQKFLNWILPKLKMAYLLPSFLKLNRIRSESMLIEKLPPPWKDHQILVGSFFGVEIERELPEHVCLVGPILNNESKLPNNIREWLEVNSNKHTIYVSFGTLVALNKNQIDRLIKAFSLSNVRVIWSLAKEYHSILPSLSDDFFVGEYLPQVAILKHEI